MGPAANRIRRGRLMAMAGMSWAAMLTAGALAWTSLVGLRGQHAPDEPLIELASLFLVVMAVPFAMVLLAVYAPVLFVGGILLGRRPWRLALVGGATGPLAGLVLVVAGHLRYSKRPTIWADLEAMGRDPLYVVPWLLVLVAGGLVFGFGIGWSIETRSNGPLQPTSGA